MPKRPYGHHKQCRRPILLHRIFRRQDRNTVNLRSPFGLAVVGECQRFYSNAAEALQNFPSQISCAKKDYSILAGRQQLVEGRLLARAYARKRLAQQLIQLADVLVDQSRTGSTIMFCANSLRSRNGHRSSRGLETNDPSAR